MNDVITPPHTPPRDNNEELSIMPSPETPQRLIRRHTRRINQTQRRESPRESIRRQMINMSNLSRLSNNLSGVFEEMHLNEPPQAREYNLNNYPPYSNYSLQSVDPKTFSPSDLAFDVIEGGDVPIETYLNEPGTESQQRFILYLNNEYICQSLEGMKLSNSYQGSVDDFNQFYECKDDTPSSWQGNSYIKDWLKPDGKGPLLKIMGPGGSNYLIEKPSFFWNGPVPEPRVFNMVELPYKIKKYISSFVLPIRENFSAYGVDHCNQLSPERVYRLELMTPRENVGGKLHHKRKTQKRNKSKTKVKRTKTKVKRTKSKVKRTKSKLKRTKTKVKRRKTKVTKTKSK